MIIPIDLDPVALSLGPTQLYEAVALRAWR
jgi:hypothetical protein